MATLCLIWIQIAILLSMILITLAEILLLSSIHALIGHLHMSWPSKATQRIFDKSVIVGVLCYKDSHVRGHFVR